MRLYSMLEGSPLEQFTITGVGGVATVWLQVTVVGGVAALVGWLTRQAGGLVPSRWSLVSEVAMASVSKVVKEQMAGSLVYAPFLTALFVLILLSNLYGNVPHSYALTASAVVSLGLSVVIFLGVTLLAVSVHKAGFFSFFVPEGTPVLLKPLLFVIELVSYSSRSLSLGTRLMANITAGHTLLYTCSGILVSLLSIGLTAQLAGAPLVVLFLAITGLELAVSFIQAFIFLLLCSSYLKDAIHLH